MNKGELIDRIAAETKATKKDIDAILGATINTIVETVASGEKVTLVGFGTFESRHRKERETINPKTQEKLITGAKNVPAFSAGKQFKEAVR